MRWIKIGMEIQNQYSVATEQVIIQKKQDKLMIIMQHLLKQLRCCLIWNILQVAFGSQPAEGGAIAEVLKQRGHNVKASDIIDYGYKETIVKDFFEYKYNEEQRDIITNPPYKYAQKFVEHSMEISENGTKIAMFLKLTFLEGQKRKAMFEKYPPKRVYVSSSRLNCVKNGDFSSKEASAVAYAWFVWEKGFKGNPEIHWFN